MAGKKLETTVVIGGRLEASINKAMEAVGARMNTLQAAADKASTACDKLSDLIQDQSTVLDAAKKRYAAYVLTGEKGSEQARELAKEIKKMSTSLSKNKATMKAAEKAAEKLTGGMEEMSDAAADAEGGFTVMKGAIAGVIANGITTLISKCADAAKSIYGLAESTREYREDMIKLDTAFKAANHTAATAEATYSALYGVIGETDQAVEAAQQIALLAQTEQDAAKWADLAAGVVGRFGDALQPETFFESANETIKLGEATGAFTQMLEGAGYSVDEFNEYLAKCSTESQKQAFMLGVTDQILGEASKSYRDANGSIIEARLANSEYTDTVAEMGAIIEPITTKVQEGFTSILKRVIDLVTDGNVEAFGAKIDDAFGNFVDKVLPKIISAMEWISNNTGLLTGIAVAIGVVAAAIGVMNAVMAVQNAIMLASPVTWIVLGIVAAVAALIAIIVLCVKHWDKIKAAALSAVKGIVKAWGTVSTWINDNVIKPVVGFFTGLWHSAVSIFQRIIDWVKNNWQSIILFIINPFYGVFSYLYNNFEGFRTFVDNFLQKIKDGFGSLVDGIKEFFVNGFGSLAGLVKAPINAVISIVNGAIDGINAIGFDIPDWVPGIGGSKFALDIPKIPMLATGGFTDGISIAGEKAVEAVISFDPAYRSENLAYWAQAGRMLGADYSDFSLGESGSTTSYNMGGVTFAPNITVTGNADKQSIMEAIEEEYPEFIDMLEEWFVRRREPAYG